MSTGRMEAFSDGVVAILITVMVLELPKPRGVTWSALHDSLPVLLAYVLAVVVYVMVALIWLVPDRRVERTVTAAGR